MDLITYMLRCLSPFRDYAHELSTIPLSLIILWPWQEQCRKIITKSILGNGIPFFRVALFPGVNAFIPRQVALANWCVLGPWFFLC